MNRTERIHARRDEMLATASDEQLLQIANEGTGIERQAARSALVKRHVPKIGPMEAGLNNEWYFAKRNGSESEGKRVMREATAQLKALAERGETARAQSAHPHVPDRLGK